MKTALQLYTILEQINADLDGTLRKVADLGLDGIEIHFDLPPPAAQVKSIVDACGLEICAMHVGFYELRDRFEEIANYQHTLENRSVVLPWLPPELRASEQAWKQTIAEIRAIAERCQEADLQLSYHNHDFEYLDQVEGMTACQYMFKTVPAPLLEIEMDTYFLVETGQDPAAAIRSFAGRSRLLHLKDPHPEPAQSLNTEIGSGTVPWPAVLSAAHASGIEWLILEQEYWAELPVWESLRKSADFLHRALGRQG
jgi:sugar phosphate isomerase/epimerase